MMSTPFQPSSPSPFGVGVLGLGVALLLAMASTAHAEPENLRQVREGYWLSAMPSSTDVEGLQERGIRVVVSLAYLDRDTRRALRDAGIAHVAAYSGRSFPQVEKLGPLLEATPEEVLIHCRYGGDRTGVVLAWLLVVRHGWPVDQALLAVLYPSDRDLGNLLPLLEARGLCVTEEEREEFLGIYSGAQNGGTGGLKLLHADYTTLVEAMLDALPPEPTGPSDTQTE